MTINKEMILSFGLPGLNEIIKAASTHRMVYAKMKKRYTAEVADELRIQKCIPKKPYNSIDIEFTWVESSRARDPDNARVGAKFVLDAMVHQGIIPDDSMRHVKIISDNFRRGKDRAVLVRWTVNKEV